MTLPLLTDLGPAHTALACRVLHRPRNRHEWPEAVDDLVREAAAGQIDGNARDVDGSSLVALALLHWQGWPSAHHRADPPPRIPALYPLPGEPWPDQLQVETAPWQRAAATLIWKGANPFAPWPDPKELGKINSNFPVQCAALVAVEVGAWDVLAQCLRHPLCPPASAWNAVRGSRGRPLLHIAVEAPAGRALLLAHGLDPDVADGEGRTTLFAAETPEAVKDLIAAGADPHRTDALGNNAPTHWGAVWKSPKPLIDAWRNCASVSHSSTVNGRMVVSALRANSWKTVEAALRASVWDPLTPVDPEQHPTRRLLPAAAVSLLQNIRGANKAIAVKPLLELLVIPRFAGQWTAEEKGWAACALWLIQGLSHGAGWAFASGSYNKSMDALTALLKEADVVAHLESAFEPLMQAVAQDGTVAPEDDGEPTHLETALWTAWINELPVKGEGDGRARWNTLALLMSAQSPSLEEAIQGMRWKSGRVFTSLVQDDGLSDVSADALLGALRLRAKQGLDGDLKDADAAWRKAWDALPDRPCFPHHLPWVQEFIVELESDDTPDSIGPEEAGRWRAWGLGQNLPAAPGRSVRHRM